MAIIFTKDIASDRLLMAYNNNIVRFGSDSELIPATGQIIGLGIDALLYPHPNKTFYFNFQEYVTSLINTKNFVDDLDYDLIDGDVNSFIYDVADGCYLEGDVTFKINFTDGTSESITRSVHFIAGVEQLETYKKNRIDLIENNIVVLSPVQTRTNNSTYLKFWEGYPFEFSFYNGQYPDAELKLLNRSNGLDLDITSKSKVNSLFLTDGRIDVSIEDFLPLLIGHNDLAISVDDVDQNLNLIINKIDSECGVYVKFLNKYSKWNYWLFSPAEDRQRTSKYLTEISNDFKNLEDTQASTIQSGKVGDESLKVIAKRLTQNDKLILEGIIDSPKILLFTGERFSKADASDWMEVRLKTTSFDTKLPNTKIYSPLFEFDFPERYAITL